MASTLRKLAQILGLLKQDPDTFLERNKIINKNDLKKINELIEKRNIARLNKSWEEADLIREKLLSMGISLEDKEDRTIWKVNYR